MRYRARIPLRDEEHREEALDVLNQLYRGQFVDDYFWFEDGPLAGIFVDRVHRFELRKDVLLLDVEGRSAV